MVSYRGSLCTGAAALLSRAVAAELKREMKLSWTPSFCKVNAVRWTSQDSWHLEVRVHCFVSLYMDPITVHFKCMILV